MVTQLTTVQLKAQNTDFSSPSNSAAVAISKQSTKREFSRLSSFDVFYSPLVLLNSEEARDAEIKVMHSRSGMVFYYFADNACPGKPGRS